MKKYNLAIVGATGMVGRTFIEILEERNFPVNNLYSFASSRSSGSIIEFMGNDYKVEELTETSFNNKNIDIALFSAGAAVSQKFAPIAVSNGCIVVDNSSAWRMDKNVPLVVPEVNPEEVKNNKGIIANPNCSTIQSVIAVNPLHKKYGIKRIIYNTYQAVSGAGMGGVFDLENGLKGGSPIKFPHPIANNCIPHIDVFLDNGYTKEEIKMINETRKIIGDNKIKITATTVRVPVFNCHSISINLELKEQFEISDVIETLKNSPGIIVQDDIQNNIYPMAITANEHDEVFIGRIRRDDSIKNGLNLWVVADNIRKGAATNTVQIAELLIKNV